ncbi:SCO3242 family prenyltransferase [Actinoplanes sp. NPDC049802]|uniref:SCO3242 family prenyltransferase n=1 Tax=Actinoplanes sp. NPDC049802 TaxID=3154742 RepID=UPI00340BE5EC
MKRRALDIRRPTFRSVVELVRAPAALSVPGDLLAGAAAAGWPFGRRRTAAMIGSSVCLYWAGMALNDYADREIDAKERPDRPIPSGRVTPDTALSIAGGLTAAGLLIAGVAGGRKALGVTLPLTAGIWAYDLALKDTPAGAPSMAFARAMNVLHGAGTGGWRAAARPAGVTAAHTLTLMAISRREVEGSSAVLPAATLAATTAVGVAAPLIGGDAARPVDRAVAAALSAVYTGTFGRSQLEAVNQPTPKNLQKAVGSGIMSLVPLQAALTARAGATRAALALLAALPIGRALSRKVTTT